MYSPITWEYYLKVSMSLSEFHKWVKDVVRNACEEALIVEGFVPDPVSTEREGIPILVIIADPCIIAY